ncbi:MAG: carboxypeptidase regulatory-like domain-containing protein [Acidobacteria bacterium]|nr:MAG: carboxypeptidase regulatory-like domain-containing protein [Acidobacteriota bacterium]REK02652.1 MAG: carboxypeptidase regulatory-like domain-containing protein [Acidobacteriota bacterium]REK13544.1 MAG: carboxypeptidase regulatory-like domain-containing protein [Acidobacteriota bacterium]REK41538.1 MAG: carboxypeptidase regulatory-like domain-containing protein [Acidobacteriota bacterium]
MKRVLLFPLIVGLVVSLSAIALAQDSGSIKGKVRDTDGDGIAGVTVTARKDGKNLVSESTDKDGKFRLSGLKPGFYNVVFEKSGFAGGVMYDVEVRRKKTNNLGDRLVLRVDQGTLVILEASVFTQNGFVLPGARIKVEEVISEDERKEVAEGYSSRDGDALFRFPEKETTYRITATWRGRTAFKEIKVDVAAIYRTSITIDVSDNDN